MKQFCSFIHIREDGEDKVTIETPSSSILEQPISQDDAEEVVDLTDDSQMTAIH